MTASFEAKSDALPQSTGCGKTVSRCRSAVRFPPSVVKAGLAFGLVLGVAGSLSMSSATSQDRSGAVPTPVVIGLLEDVPSAKALCEPEQMLELAGEAVDDVKDVRAPIHGHVLQFVNPTTDGRQETFYVGVYSYRSTEWVVNNSAIILKVVGAQISLSLRSARLTSYLECGGIYTVRAPSVNMCLP
ncbi:MAG TPA: hypothetical protein PK264_22960, partial [Hyphomicrobiaceae bacterium]|nr:hypothetical protein [Hyphomicrobiaceae bacterium]